MGASCTYGQPRWSMPQWMAPDRVARPEIVDGSVDKKERPPGRRETAKNSGILCLCLCVICRQLSGPGPKWLCRFLLLCAHWAAGQGHLVPGGGPPPPPCCRGQISGVFLFLYFFRFIKNICRDFFFQKCHPAAGSSGGRLLPPDEPAVGSFRRGPWWAGPYRRLKRRRRRPLAPPTPPPGPPPARALPRAPASPGGRAHARPPRGSRTHAGLCRPRGSQRSPGRRTEAALATRIAGTF